MKAWSEFYPDVLPELPGAPLPMVDHWLRNAAIEFCEESKALRINLTPVDGVAEQMEYLLPMPDDGGGTPVVLYELVEIIQAKFSGEKLTPIVPVELEKKYDDWEAEVGTPEHYTQADTFNILLIPAPTDAATDAIEVKAALKPTPSAMGVSDWLFSQYRQALAAGVKAKMMAQANRPWSNPDMSIFYADVFADAISTATTRANDGYTRATPRFSGSFC